MGSEMCIRDRSTGGRGALRSATGLPEGNSTKPRRLPNPLCYLLTLLRLGFFRYSPLRSLGCNDPGERGGACRCTADLNGWTGTAGQLERRVV